MSSKFGFVRTFDIFTSTKYLIIDDLTALISTDFSLEGGGDNYRTRPLAYLLVKHEEVITWNGNLRFLS